jgi:hypothetical protein
MDTTRHTGLRTQWTCSSLEGQGEMTRGHVATTVVANDKNYPLDGENQCRQWQQELAVAAVDFPGHPEGFGALETGR